MKKILGVVLVLVVLLALWGWSGYNSLVSGDEAVKAQWANVESVYQRRFDLIPNIVETVKGAAAQDLEVFSRIADARSRYAGAASVDEKAAAAGEVESALARLLVIVEQYPTLKSQESFQALIAELEGSENRIAVERRRYNEVARDFNVQVRKFPRNLVAAMFGFNQHELFEATDGAEQAPDVNFTE